MAIVVAAVAHPVVRSVVYLLLYPVMQPVPPHGSLAFQKDPTGV